MFKEYKYLKLFLSVILLIFIVMQWNKDIQNSVIIFTNKLSYANSAKIDLELDQPVEIVVAKTNKEIVYTGPSDKLKEQSLDKGLYSINDKYPLVIKGDKSEEITIVFPYLNNLLYSKDGGELVINKKSDTLSMNYQSSVTEIDLNMFSILTQSAKSFNVITEIDLQDSNDWNTSRIVILYGKTKFYSALMTQKIRDYVMAGGNILLISSAYSEYDLKFDAESKLIIKSRDEKGNMVRLKDKIPVHESYGGIASSNVLTIFNSQVGQEKYNLITGSWCNYVNDNDESTFEAYGDISIDGKINTKALIGKIKLSESSGSIFYIGSEDVLLDVNIQNEAWSQAITEFVKKAIIG